MGADVTWHECWAFLVGLDWFGCRRCEFRGTLRDAIGHIVAMQPDLTK